MNPAGLLDALAAREGLVAAIGAGGKKSTLYRLVEAHLACGTSRVGLTCTVLSAPPPPGLGSARLIAEPEALAADLPAFAQGARIVVFATPSRKPGRLGGLPTDMVPALHRTAGFSVTLIKADGARMRMIKAPAEDEPLLPPGVGTVLALVSVRAVGRALDETVAHRPERVAAVTGAAPGEPLTVDHLARLLSSPQGSLQDVKDATVVPIVNMVDDASARLAARKIAERALAATRRFDRVVLAAMTAHDPLIEVIKR